MNEKKDLSHLDTHDHAGHGHDHTGDSCCSTTQTSDCGCEHPQGKGKLPTYFWPLVSLILLLMGLGVDFFKWVFRYFPFIFFTIQAGSPRTDPRAPLPSKTPCSRCLLVARGALTALVGATPALQAAAGPALTRLTDGTSV